MADAARRIFQLNCICAKRGEGSGDGGTDFIINFIQFNNNNDDNNNNDNNNNNTEYGVTELLFNYSITIGTESVRSLLMITCTSVLGTA